MAIEENPDPRYNVPSDLAQAKTDRIAALEYVRDNSPDPNRVVAAQYELDQINARGYAWPFNSGYPVSGPFYSDADQQ